MNNPKLQTITLPAVGTGAACSSDGLRGGWSWSLTNELRDPAPRVEKRGRRDEATVGQADRRTLHWLLGKGNSCLSQQSPASPEVHQGWRRRLLLFQCQGVTLAFVKSVVPFYLFPLQLLGIGGKVNSTMRVENSSPRPASHLLFSSVIIS